MQRVATVILIETVFAIKVHFRKPSCYYVPVCRHLNNLVTNAAAVIGTVSLVLLATTVSVMRNFVAARSPVDMD